MKFKTKSMIATFIILFISGSAFLAGFLQEYYAGSAADLRSNVESLQTILNRMENRVQFLYQHDLDFDWQQEEYLIKANQLDLEYGYLNSTLTPGEREVYLYRIIDFLILASLSRNSMVVLQWFHHFRTSNIDFIIASKKDDGYDLLITSNMWSGFENVYHHSIIDVLTAYEYYGHFSIYNEIQNLPLNSRPLDYWGFETEQFTKVMTSVEIITDYFLFSQVRDTQEEIDQILEEVANLETQASQIGLGVAMTTIAVILSTAMANRLNQRKIEREFERIREKEARLIKKKPDLISIPVLIIASILAIVGVILPLFLNFFL